MVGVRVYKKGEGREMSVNDIHVVKKGRGKKKKKSQFSMFLCNLNFSHPLGPMTIEAV